MGGAGLYHPPVLEWDWISTYDAHTNRGTPSKEPGVDWGCPRFTELHAAASGVVFEIDYGIVDPTGRFITIDLDDGHRVRYLHLEEIHVTVGQRVAWGEIIGKTGATGYGEADWSWNVAETGGAHVHMTVFPGHYYVFGRYATLDPWPLTDTSRPEAALPKDEDMIFDNGNRILWPNGFFNAYDPSVYNALKYWHETGTEQPGTEGTVIREVWAANNYMTALQARAAADAVKALLGSAGIEVKADVGQIVAGVLKGLPTAPTPPKSYTVTPNV